VLFSAKLKEGGGESALPPQEQKTQFGYRIGDQGSFTDAGFIDSLDQRTGQRMPRPISSCRQIRARPSSISPGATDAASRPTSSPSISTRKRRSPRARRKSWKSYG